ncbi:MAG: hypothetical protein PHU04_05010 [Candidatus Peribacteraceae bacterium]|nr:hypothetical protein [Candidatus Peribacteraceae bacterium]
MENAQNDLFQEGSSSAVADALYAEYMLEHEPDLLDENIDTLDAKYAGESPKDKAAREARYEKALDGYEAMVSELAEDLNEQNRQARRKALKIEEATETVAESEKIQQVDEEISNM